MMARVCGLLAIVLLAFPVIGIAGEPCEKEDFTCGDIPALTEAGLKGDGHAALKLSWLYADKDDQRANVFWTRVAIENGNVIARRNYAVLLSQRAEHACLVRARFLLATMIGEGTASDTAPALLKSVDRKLSLATKQSQVESVPCGL